ncbi:MAG: MBL fold metallo-hydrolase [Planctomycetales bacterium]|nr:MBL fold metallo-hydrolase [Planctomycetales bacterium]
MGITVRFWGTRGGIPTPGPTTVRYGGNTPCVEVRAGGVLFILDAGTGIRELGVHLLKQGGPVEAHLLISHAHWDHIQGFPFFAPAYVPGNRLTVYGSQGSRKGIQELLEHQMVQDYFPVELKEMSADLHFVDLEEGGFRVGPVEVTTQYLNHPGLSMSVRLRHEGKTFVYSSDTEPFRELLGRQKSAGDSGLDRYVRDMDDRLSKFAQGADLMVVDGQYTPEEYSKKLGWGHSSMDDAAEAARRAGARRVAIYHHDPLHTDDFLDAQMKRLQESLRQKGATIECLGAREGLEVAL